MSARKKPGDEDREDEDRENDVGLAMVALRRRALDPKAVVRSLRKRFGIEATVAKKDEPVVISLEDAEAYVVTLPLPLPARDMEAAAERSWHFPGAEVALSQHEAHAVVTVASRKGTGRLEQALRLTRVVAAIADGENAAAVYWGAAGLLHEPADFLDEIESAGPEYVPVMLWVSLTPFLVKKKKHMATRGLKELGRLEIEAELEGPFADRLLEFLPDLIAGVVLSEREVADGDTVGGSEKEKFKVRVRKSHRGDEKVLFISGRG
jgi:hypothetical protein